MLNFVSEMRITLDRSAFLPSWAEHCVLFWMIWSSKFQQEQEISSPKQTGTGVHPASYRVGTVKLVYWRHISWELRLLHASNYCRVWV